MLSLLLWMVTDFENVTAEVQRDKQTENWSRYSVALHIFLPVAGLAIFLKQKHILSRLLLQLDRNCVSVLCPSLSRRENLLKWAGSRLPQTWSSQSKTLSGGIADLWYDGSLLCTLINSVVPGACLNPHKHWKKPPLHAQAIAYKYLGVVPMFTENDLSQDLTVTLERTFLQYLSDLQQAIIRLSERNLLNKITSVQYFARGMGLYTGEQHRKTVFYVYPHEGTKTRNNSNIIIHIRGPYGTYGKAVIPKFHSDLFTAPEIKVTTDLLLAKKLLRKNIPAPENSLIRSFSLPFMQYHKKHMGDNIIIHVTMEKDRAKVTYIPQNYGIYEVIMISNGELIRGCPFNVHILSNTSGIEETFAREEQEEEIPHIRKRKIISKTIDFVNEKLAVADLEKRYKNREGYNSKSLSLTTDKTQEIDNEETNESTFEEKEVPKTDIQLKSVEHTKNNSFYIGEKEIEEEEEDYLFSQAQKMDGDVVDAPNLNEDNGPSMEKYFTVLEKQNLESVNERVQKRNKDNRHSESETEQEEANAYNNKTIISGIVDTDVPRGINLMPNKKVDWKPIEVQGKQDYDNDTRANIFKTRLSLNEYPRPITVHKIQIPEKFSKIPNLLQKTETDLNIKYFKNVINRSNKKETLTKLAQTPAVLEEDELKLVKKTVENVHLLHRAKSMVDEIHGDVLEDNEVKRNLITAFSRRNSAVDIRKVNSIPSRFFQPQAFPQENSTPPSPSLENQRPASPVCADHIVPEVNSEFWQMSVAEKRKVFAKQAPVDVSTPTNSSLSEAENVEISKTPRHFQQIEGLKVMNFLSSLKQSESSRKPTPNPLVTAKSLPNLPSIETNYVYKNSVKERKNFWEKLSTSSSSLNINVASSSKRKSNKLTEDERSRLIWRKSSNDINANSEEQKYNLYENSEICKSADNILFITECISYQNSKKYKSVDESLDDCSMLSIEERKKRLLKQNYEKEMAEREKLRSLKRKHSVKTIGNTNERRSENKDEERNSNGDNNEAVIFTPILDKIKKYDSVCNLTKNTKPEEMKVCNNDSSSSKKNINDINDDPKGLPPPEKITIKSHFKKAIKYFKNLEEKSLGKSKPKLDKRRYSLDMQPKRNKGNRRGGSLNLQNVSERFSISNLYEDVFKKKGSFKGAANRSALVEALAMFSKESNSFKEDNEDDIKYDLFKKRAKRKSRKSIRSIFDVYY